MKNQQGEVFGEVELITPEMAKDYLLHMIKGQRPFRQSQVDAFAAMMSAGKWHISQPIAFDKHGNLLDGQHRLRAVIQCGLPQKFVVNSGYETESAQYMDLGKKRTVVDVAHLMGEGWVRDFHTSTLCAMFLNPTTQAKEPHPSPEAKITLLLKHKEAITFATSLLVGQGFKHSAFTSVIARAYYSQNKQRLEEFAHVLLSGVCSLDEDNAPIKLRDYFLSRDKKSQAEGSMGRHSLVSLTSQALKNFVDRKHVKKLFGTSRNYFPVADFDAWWS